MPKKSKKTAQQTQSFEQKKNEFIKNLKQGLVKPALKILKSLTDEEKKALSEVEIELKNNQKLPAFLFVTKKGYQKLVEEFLNPPEININMQSSQISGQHGALHYTSACPPLFEIHQRLIQRGALSNIKDIDNQTPLYMTVKHNNLKAAKELLNKNAEVNTQNTLGHTPLIECVGDMYNMGDKESHASVNDRLELIQALIEKGADITLTNNQGQNFFDILNANPSILNQNKGDMIQHTLSFIDEYQGKEAWGQAQKLAISAKENAETKPSATHHIPLEESTFDKAKKSLQTAINSSQAGDILAVLNVLQNNEELSKEQIQELINDTKDTNGNTVLHIAANKAQSDQYLKVIELSLKLGADILKKNNSDDTALKIVQRSNDTNTMIFFMDYCNTLTYKNTSNAVTNAISKNNINKLEEAIILYEQSKVDQTHSDDFKKLLSTPHNNEYGENDTALMMAIRNYKPELVTKLITLGADINCDNIIIDLLDMLSDDNIKTLDKEAFQKTFEITHLLLDAGVSLIIPDTNNNHPTQLISEVINNVHNQKYKFEFNNEDITALKNLRNKIFYTTLKQSIDKNDTEFFEATLLDFKGVVTPDEFYQFINQIDEKVGSTLLHYAVQNDNAEIVQLLLSNGADPSIKDKEGKTALEYAKENPEIIKILNKTPATKIQSAGRRYLAKQQFKKLQSPLTKSLSKAWAKEFKQNSELKKELSITQKYLKKSEKSTHQLTEENDRIKGDLKTLQSSYNTSIEQANTSTEQATGTISNLNAQINNLNNTIQQLKDNKQKASSIEKKLQKAQSELENLKKEKEKVDKQLAEKVTELGHQKSETSKEQAEKKGLEGQVNSLTENYQKLQTAIEDKQTALKEAQEEKKAFKAETQSKDKLLLAGVDEIDRLSTKVSELKEKLSTTNAAKELLKIANQAAVKELEEKLQTAQTEITQLRVDNQGLHSINVQTQQKLSRLNSALPQNKWVISLDLNEAITALGVNPDSLKKEIKAGDTNPFIQLTDKILANKAIGPKDHNLSVLIKSGAIHPSQLSVKVSNKFPNAIAFLHSKGLNKAEATASEFVTSQQYSQGQERLSHSEHLSRPVVTLRRNPNSAFGIVHRSSSTGNLGRLG